LERADHARTIAERRFVGYTGRVAHSNTSARKTQPQAIAVRAARRVVVARCLIAAAVLTMHIIAVAPSFIANSGYDGILQGPLSTEMEVTLLPATTPPQALYEPRLRRITAMRPPPFPESLIAEKTLPGLGNSPTTSKPRDEPRGSPPFERLMVDAKLEDAGSLRKFCDDSYPPESRLPNEQGTVVLLIRIEPDGHVSDTTIEESSGSQRLDRVTQACVMAGSFEPRRSGWQAVPSWQRVHWNWSNR
jgi:TonB family protein